MKRYLPKNAEDAFSLIEVIIALGIFAFVVVPIIALVSSGMKSLRQSMDDSVRGKMGVSVHFLSKNDNMLVII